MATTAQDDLEQLLTGPSADEIRTLCIEALRTWWKTKHRRENPAQFAMHSHLGRGLVSLLAGRVERALSDSEIGSMSEEVVKSQHMLWMGDVHDSIWSLVQAGFLIPLGVANASFPITFKVTRRGQRFLESDDDHPFLPGYLSRFNTLKPPVPTVIIGLFADARTCLDHSLLRPAVIVLGVAYELAIDAVVDNLVTLGLATSKTPGMQASDKVKAVRTAVNSQQIATLLPTSEGRVSALAAIDFADDLRTERNKGAHTAAEFDSKGETEEFLVSAGRHFAALWALAKL